MYLHYMKNTWSEAEIKWLTISIGGEDDFSNWLPVLLNVIHAPALDSHDETVGISRLYSLQIMRLVHTRGLSLHIRGWFTFPFSVQRFGISLLCRNIVVCYFHMVSLKILLQSHLFVCSVWSCVTAWSEEKPRTSINSSSNQTGSRFCQ